MTFAGRCRVPRCHSRPTRLGLCPPHYYRWYRTGDPGTADSGYGIQGCAVPGCERPHRAHGYCVGHVKTHWDPTLCRRIHCQRRVVVRKHGLCPTHYSQLLQVLGMIEIARRG